MTGPQPWPYTAERARQDAIRMAGQIAEWAEAGRQGRTNAPLAFADIKAKALEIKTTLLECPHCERGE